MNKIRWGMIGCGDVTEKKSGPAFQKASNSELIAVMGRDSSKVKDYASRHNVPKWYTDADMLINDPDIDAVYIATPPDSHKRYTLKVSAAGKPVYVEKPMARCYQECLDMIAVCKKNDVKIFTAYYRRSLPKFIKIKELLNSDYIGDIRNIMIMLYIPVNKLPADSKNVPWRVKPEISGGGYFVDLASHTLDILQFFFGFITHANGIAVNQANLYPAEDTVCATFIFEGGIPGSGIWCFSSNNYQDLIKIVGTKGNLTFPTFADDPIQLTTDTGEQETWKFDRPEHIQQPHIQSIVDELLGKGKCPSNGYSAAKTNWVIDEILKGWRNQHNIKFL